MVDGFRRHLLVRAIRRLGALALAPVIETGRMGLFLATALVTVVIPPYKPGLLLKQIHFVGYQSILVIILTGLFTGMVLGFQGYYTLTRFGSEAMLGPMVGLSLVKELGPVLTGLMVTARAGSAVTAEIGIMRIGEEIDALQLMGLNPHRYLVAPVLTASVICLPLLMALFNVVGIYGGYLVGVRLLGVNAGTYIGEMAAYVTTKDITGGIYKSLAFGGLIAWVCCYKGYHAGFGAEGVSKATTQAVVLTSVLILAADYFLTPILP